MEKQISFFEMLGEAETPLIHFEEQKEGRRGWIIDISAILLRKNGFKDDAVCVCTQQVVFQKDSEIDKYGRISQMCKTTHGEFHGWCGYQKEVYAKRPTWEECYQFARKKYTIPEKVLYYERDGKDRSIWDYDEGYKGGK